MNVRAPLAVLALVLVAGCTSGPRPRPPDAASATPTVAPSTGAQPPAEPSMPVLTPFPTVPAGCDEDGTTLEMAACEQQDALRAEAAVNRLLSDLWQVRDAEGRRLLAESHDTWLAYRKAACLSYGDTARGGSIAQVLVPGCLARLTEERAEALRAEAAAGLDD